MTISRATVFRRKFRPIPWGTFSNSVKFCGAVIKMSYISWRDIAIYFHAIALQVNAKLLMLLRHTAVQNGE